MFSFVSVEAGLPDFEYWELLKRLDEQFHPFYLEGKPSLLRKDIDFFLFWIKWKDIDKITVFWHSLRRSQRSSSIVSKRKKKMTSEAKTPFEKEV